MKRFQLDVAVTRGGRLESRHSVSGVVIGERGDVIATAGDHETSTYWRSCAKPFQVMPLLEADAFDAIGWDEPELAVACGSHGGEPEHVAVVTSMLSDVGLEEGDLACGPHDPLSARGLKALNDRGGIAGRIHNNCSGKHAAMLARAVTAGWRPDGYERESHEVQQAIFNTVAHWAGVQRSSLEVGIDGCGVPVFMLPLAAMATAYARFGQGAERGDEIPERIVAAMRRSFFMVGGTDRFDSILIEDSGGRVIAKVGAEGVHSFCVPELGIGAAIKVADGAVRAQHCAVIHLLQRLDALPTELPPRLADFLRRPVRNTMGDVVGSVEPLDSFLD
jgi:L-asparaginase II